MARMQMTAVLALAMALVVGTLLTACAPARVPGAAGPGDTLDLGTPGALIEIVEDVGYYPACGNEVLVRDGISWYPFRPANAAEFPMAAAAGATVLARGGLGGGTMRGPLPAVANPGPGDDVGTLVIYERGFARWTADSGDLHTWLTTQALEYSWVC